MDSSIEYTSVEIDEIPGIIEKIQDAIYDKLTQMYSLKTIYIKKYQNKNKFICICETLKPLEIVNDRIEEQEKILASANKSDIIGFTSLFGVLSTSKIKKISPLLKKKKVSLDTVIFEENDISEELYIIKSGKVLIYKYIDEEKKKFEVLASLCKGDIFGEMGILDNATRFACARAVLEPCELYCMKKNDFLNILQTYPEISLNLSKIYSDRLRATGQQLIKHLRGLPAVTEKSDITALKDYRTSELSISEIAAILPQTNKSAEKIDTQKPVEKIPLRMTSKTISAEEIIQKRREKLLSKSKTEDLSRGILFRKPKEPTK
ncbi:MAG: cyclic nucleotide-binding domain-containing protein [Candidatus Eremiobacterota bacterium]